MLVSNIKPDFTLKFQLPPPKRLSTVVKNMSNSVESSYTAT